MGENGIRIEINKLEFFSRITFIYFLHSLKIRKRFSDVR